ncbi:dihydroneopterin aldolase [Insolitispirillum peregrinum]|uniref:dihydroneopterin aldolase n=1 Tax=Insolitispirillum peregrinum TaxID=80876 RepID=UPI00361BF6D3
MKTTSVLAPLRPVGRDGAPALADASQSLRHVFVRDLVQVCSVGIYDHEHEEPQRVRFNVDLAVREGVDPLTSESIDDVVCYEQIVKRIRAIAQDGHTNLVETLAERVASMCLQDPRVRTARVRVEKLDVFEDAASVGVEIERHSSLAG